MNEVKWVKIHTDIFNNRKIRKIERMKNGSLYVLVWLKLIVLAGEVNSNGALYLVDGLPYKPKDFAEEFNLPEEIINSALAIFENYQMIERDEDSGAVLLMNWEKYQEADKLEKIREGNRKRVAKHREKKTSECNVTVTEDVMKCNVTSNADVTQCNATEEEEEGEEEYKDNVVQKPTRHPELVRSIIDHLNEKAGTNYKATSKDTVKHIEARIAEGYLVEEFFTVIDKKVHEWAHDAKMAQYLRPATLFGTKFESYLNAPERIGKAGFNDFQQNNIDFDELERELLRK